MAKYCFYFKYEPANIIISVQPKRLWHAAGRDKISTITWQQILKIEYLNPCKQLWLLLLCSKNTCSSGERTGYSAGFSFSCQKRWKCSGSWDLNVICAILWTTKCTMNAKKNEKKGRNCWSWFLRSFSSLRALRELRGATRLQPKAERSGSPDTMRIDRD